MATYTINPQLFTLSLRQPVWTPPPITPWRPPTPIYTDQVDGVYTETTGTGTGTNSTPGTVTNIVGDTTFLQPGKPVVGDFMIFTSKVNYWYLDSDLTTKFSVPGHPTGDFQRAAGSYAGIFQGTIASYNDYKGVKRVKSFLVKVRMAYNAEGNLADTDFLLWISAESQFGAAAENQFEIGGNGYGSNGTVNPGTGTGTQTGTGSTNNEETNTGTNMKWVIIIAIIFLWVLRK